jgi:4'-phosphopantetheinyl transferase
VRTVLSRYLAVEPVEWIFSANAYGRPEIVNQQARDLCLSFNISHTKRMVVLGVTAGRALGVDLAGIGEREIPMEIANHYFAPEEVAALAATPRQEQAYRFFEYWTFKEAYIKARGMGLSLPLDQFSFHYPDARAIQIKIDPELADEPTRWRFWQFQPAKDHLVAVCAERTDAECPRLVLRWTVPLVSEEETPLEILRASE